MLGLVGAPLIETDGNIDIVGPEFEPTLLKVGGNTVSNGVGLLLAKGRSSFLSCVGGRPGTIVGLSMPASGTAVSGRSSWSSVVLLYTVRFS